MSTAFADSRFAPAVPATTPALRLTARGRAVVRALTVAGALMVATMLILAGVLLAGGHASASQESRSPQVTYHLVMPGETLWGLAEQVAPSSDPRDVVAAIVELNHLPGASVAAGQRLALPVVS